MFESKQRIQSESSRIHQPRRDGRPFFRPANDNQMRSQVFLGLICLYLAIVRVNVNY